MARLNIEEMTRMQLEWRLLGLGCDPVEIFTRPVVDLRSALRMLANWAPVQAQQDTSEGDEPWRKQS